LLLLAGEVVGVAFLFIFFFKLKGRLQKQLIGYDDIVTFCQTRGVSLLETYGLLTFAGGFIVFDMFMTLVEDDSLEAISYTFGIVLFLAIVLLAFAVDIQYYYLISCISGAEFTLRVLYTDIVNNGLCLLRIFFC